MFSLQNKISRKYFPPRFEYQTGFTKKFPECYLDVSKLAKEKIENLEGNKKNITEEIYYIALFLSGDNDAADTLASKIEKDVIESDRPKEEKELYLEFQKALRDKNRHFFISQQLPSGLLETGGGRKHDQ